MICCLQTKRRLAGRWFDKAARLITSPGSGDWDGLHSWMGLWNGLEIFHGLYLYYSHIIHVWYIYLHLPYKSTNCRQIYHTCMVWDCYKKWGSFLQNLHNYKWMGSCIMGIFSWFEEKHPLKHSAKPFTGDFFHQGTPRPQPRRFAPEFGG